MDPFSITINIVIILGLTFIVVQYINDIKNAQQKQICLCNKIINASSSLYMLYNCIKQAQMRISADFDRLNKLWILSIIALALFEGSLVQFEQALCKLERHLGFFEKIQK